MKTTTAIFIPPYKNKALGVSATLLALGSVLTSVNIANAAIFNFSFTNENGGVNGTVQGTITLPDGDFVNQPATSVIVTSAPAALGYTLPIDILGTAVSNYTNSFTVIGGMINTAASSFVAIFGGGGSVLILNDQNSGIGTELNVSESYTGFNGVNDVDSSTLTYSAAASATTIFNFSFTNEDGPIGGTVQGTITLPDGDFVGQPASNITVTSAPAALGYTLPFDVLASFTTVISNTFTVIGGIIDVATSTFLAAAPPGLNGGLTLNDPSFGTQFGANGPNSGVVDADDSTLNYSSASATTPEPTSVITVIGVGVLGVASKLKKKA